VKQNRKRSDALKRKLHDEKRWRGSHYELSLIYNTGKLDTKKRINLLRALWEHPLLMGIADDPKQLLSSWVHIDEESVKKHKHVYGCMDLGGGKIIGCGSYFLEIENYVWCIFYCPLGMLESVYNIQYPLGHKENMWMKQFDRLLVSIGIHVYQTLPFGLAAIGEEASALPVERLKKELVVDDDLLVPEKLFHEMDVKPYGLRFPEGIWWTGGSSEDQEYIISFGL
jgi:hypothetical protein